MSGIIRINGWERDKNINFDLELAMENIPYSLIRILYGNREANLVYTRVYISKKLSEWGYNSVEIGKILNKDGSTIRHYLNEYVPPRELEQQWQGQR